MKKYLGLKREINRSIKNLLFFTLFISSTIFAQYANNKWSAVPLPVRTEINQIQTLNRNECIAVAGKYLVYYKKGKWEFFKKQPPVKNIDKLLVSPSGIIWLSEATFFYESNFYLFKNNKWELIKTPFINQVKCADFLKDNKVYFGGDRELYLYNRNKWSFFKYPPTPDAITEIKANSKSILILTSNHLLFIYRNSKWKRELFGKNIIHIEKKEENYFAIGSNKIFRYNEGKNWQLFASTDKKFKIKKVLILKNLLYAISTSNELFCFKNNKWQKIDIKDIDELNDIAAITDSTVIVSGNNGITWVNSKIQLKKSEIYSGGFIKIQPLTLSKNVNDEYGVCINYLNNDSLLDIYTVRIFEPNRLYINKGIGVTGFNFFADEAVERNVSGVSNGKRTDYSKDLFLGCGVADLDNDNDRDIFLCNLSGKNLLFLNDGNGYFRDVSNEKDRAQGKEDRTNSVIFGDVDNDGDLDIFVTNEYSSNRLFINNGYGYFTDVTEEAGLKSDWGGMGAAFADIDNDNDLDICVTNWGKPNKIYKNITKNGKIKFQDISSTCGIDQSPFTKSNGCVFADIDNDGDLDLFITNRKTTNELYRNDGGKFTNITKSAIGFDNDLSYGAVFGDFDQDGFQDLYVTNIGEHKLYKNINGKKFEDVSLKAGIIQSGYGTGTAAGDLDNDGDLDIYSAAYMNSSSTIFYNEINNKKFIKCRLTGTKSNSDAVGTKLWLYDSGYRTKDHLVGYREVSSGSGYASGNPQTVHFGLPSYKNYDLVVYFPTSGIKKIIKNIPPGSTLNISEETSFNKLITSFNKKLGIIIYDREIVREEIKFIFLFIIILFSFILTNKKLKWKLWINTFIHIAAFIVYFILLEQFLFNDFFFSTVIPIVSSITYLAVVHLIYQKYFLGKRITEEKKMTREKIARDLHDDLASTISSAVIYTDFLERTNKTENTKGIIEKIHNLMINASNSVNDIIWIAATKNDTVGDLCNKIKDLLGDVADLNSIKVNPHIEITKPELIINEDYKRNIFLIVKEALNNSLKYSNCNEITFIFRQNNNSIYIELADNGIGFELLNIKGKNNGNGGRGLINMKARASTINAIFEINSEPGNGTKILLESKMT